MARCTPPPRSTSLALRRHPGGIVIQSAGRLSVGPGTLSRMTDDALFPAEEPA
jgi:hypothetical protein